MKAYDLEDPVDLQRFKLNLMCSDVVETVKDHVQGRRVGDLSGDLRDKFTKFALALRELQDATKPGGRPETGGTL